MGVWWSIWGRGVRPGGGGFKGARGIWGWLFSYGRWRGVAKIFMIRREACGGGKGWTKDRTGG